MQLLFGKLAKASVFDGQAVASLYGEQRGFTYQWQRQEETNFVDIADANSSVLRFFPNPPDFQTVFRLEALVPGKSVYSRSVKLTTGRVAAPNIAIASANGKAWITFTGTLQTAVKVSGPYADVAGATSPYAVPDATTVAFFRCVQ